MALTAIGIFGAEAGYTSGLATGNYLDAAVIGAGGSVGIETTIIEPQGGLRSFKVVSATAITYIQGQPAAGTTCAMLVGWINFGSTLPDTTGMVCMITTATGSTGDVAQIRYNPSGTKLEAIISGGSAAGSFTVAINTWYRFAMRYDVAATTYNLDWWMNGAAQTQATRTLQTIGTVGKPRWGQGTASVNSTTYYDHLVYFTCANTDSDPGNYVVWGAAPTADGTHSFTTGDFQDEASANIATGSTTSYQRVDEIPIDGGSDYIKQVVSNTNSYVEHAFDSSRWVVAPLAVEHIVAFANVSTGADNQKAQLYDGTTASNTYASVTAGSVGGQIATRGLVFATAPSGGAWTLAKLQAAKGRWGFSTDVVDPPALYAHIIEVATTPFTTVSAGLASGTGAAGAAAVSEAPNASAASGTGAAGAALANLAPNAAAAAGTGAAGAASETLKASAGNAAGTGAASTAGASLGAAAGNAPGTGTTYSQDHDVMYLLTPVATGTGAAANATVVVAASTNAAAGVATATGVAGSAIASLGAATGAATGTGAAAGETTSISTHAGAATGTGASSAPTVAIAKAVSAENAAATGQAFDVVPSILVATSANAGAINVTGAATSPAISLAPVSGVATGTGQAFDAAISLTVMAELSGGTAIAYDTVAYLATSAGVAAGTGVPGDALGAIAFTAGIATGTGEARDPTPHIIQSGIGIAPVVGRATLIASNAGRARTAVPEVGR